MRRAYRYGTHEDILAILLLGLISASPFLIARKVKKKCKMSNKTSLAEHMENARKNDTEKIRELRQKLWDILKEKRNSDGKKKWLRRIKRYGFSPDGTHIKTGINYDTKKGVQKMSIDIKGKLKSLEGETFHTVTGLSFTYSFANENTIKVSRTDFPIALSNFEKAIELSPTTPGEISSYVYGSSYVFGIIFDSRFK